MTGLDFLAADGIVDAKAVRDSDFVSVDLAFSEGAARTIEKVTTHWVGRRLAIVLDGEVQSVPVVMSPIKGTHSQITLADSDPAQAFTHAKSLAQRLKP